MIDEKESIIISLEEYAKFGASMYKLGMKHMTIHMRSLYEHTVENTILNEENIVKDWKEKQSKIVTP